jgi:hypothetical protein
MFEDWKLGKYMDAAYQVMCEWYPGEEGYNQKEILKQMHYLTKDTTFYQAVLALLVYDGAWGTFGHHDKCELIDLDEPDNCVACHIVKDFYNNVVNQKVIVPEMAKG